MKYNYFNFKKWDVDSVLLTNDFGEWAFVSSDVFQQMLGKALSPQDATFQLLADKGFVYETTPEVYIEKYRDKLQASKAYLFDATSLHIFVMTNECNARCVYCQAQSDCSHIKGVMTPDVADKALEIMFQSPNPYLSLEFQGGEPLLNFPVIQHITVRAEQLAKQKRKHLELSLVSNLTLLSDDMIAFLKEHNVSISTSIDGPEFLQALNRPLRNGKNTYQGTIRGLYRLREHGVMTGAIETTTRFSLDRWKEIVDTYKELDLHSIFLRPLTPLGLANEDWNRIGYTAEEFIEFYRNALLYIIELNKQGYYMSEGHASTFLTKILGGLGINYMELRSPCGAAVGQMAYYYNGDVFTCDEGRMLSEMGDNAFKLGTVNNTYDELMNSSACKACGIASTLETAPTCYDGVYQPYCGTCPVVNYALDDDIFPKQQNSYRCAVYKGMLDALFTLLRENDPDTIRILNSWKKCEEKPNE